MDAAQKNIALAARVLVWLCLAPAYVVCSEGDRKMQNAQVEAAHRIVQDMLKGRSLGFDDVASIQKTTGLLQAMLAEIRGLPQAGVLSCMGELDQLGTEILNDAQGAPDRFAGFLGDPRVVGLTVAFLDSENPEVRAAACDILVNRYIPDSLIRDHSETILSAVARHPTIPNGSLLIGITGCGKARSLLLSTPSLRGYSKDATRMALAKLGDCTAQSELVTEFTKAAPGRPKQEAAWRLGYVGSAMTVLALASEFRTDQIYVWRPPRARRSTRVDLVSGLRKAYPEEPLFWPPESKPQDDRYYEAIESWLAKNLGVKWRKSRPEFLYEDDAPIFPVGR